MFQDGKKKKRVITTMYFMQTQMKFGYVSSTKVPTNISSVNAPNHVRSQIVCPTLLNF